MKIVLDSGKELTLEEVKEIIDKFSGLFGEKKIEYIPYYPPYIPPFTPYYPEVTCSNNT